MKEENKKDYIDINNTRTEEQKQVMREIAERNHCPFCRDNLALSHKEPIIREGKHWLFTKNQWPYPGTDHHFLLISTKHIEKIEDVTDIMWLELLEIIKWAEKEYEIKGGGLNTGLRFGNTNLTGATVVHLHVHIVVPNPNAPEPVKLWLGPSRK